MRHRKELTDEQWGEIAALFIVNAIHWVLRTGAPWRDLPSTKTADA
jgi:transposase